MFAENLAALPLRPRPALPHDGGLQPQAEAAAAGTAFKEALQALGTDVAKVGCWAPGVGLITLHRVIDNAEHPNQG